jgi:hypothetical protein
MCFARNKGLKILHGLSTAPDQAESLSIFQAGGLPSDLSGTVNWLTCDIQDSDRHLQLGVGDISVIHHIFPDISLYVEILITLEILGGALYLQGTPVSQSSTINSSELDPTSHVTSRQA